MKVKFRIAEPKNVISQCHPGGDWLAGWRVYPKPISNTMPETNIAPEKEGLNSTFLVAWPIFGDYVNFSEGMNQTNSTKNQEILP